MNDRERADWLDRTIADLLRNRRQTTPPDGLDENDVDGLLRAASTRMIDATGFGKSAIRTDSALWRRVIQRLDRRRQPRLPFQHLSAPGQGARASEPTDEELRDIVATRRKMTDEMMLISESRREDVWHDLEKRPESKPQKKGWLSWFRRSSSRADQLSPALDSIAFGSAPTDVEVDFDGVLETARARKGLSFLASEAAGDRRDDVWDLVRTRVERRNAQRSEAGQTRWFRPRWALALAASASVIVAVALVPAVGLSQHPVAEAARFVGSHLGVTETDSTPPDPVAGDTIVVTPIEVDTAEASALLGVSVAQPEGLKGFELTSSQFFSQPIAADTGGTFALTYQGHDPGQSLVIYQELASNTTLTASSDSATSMTFQDGTQGTYIDGAWQVTSASGLSWDMSDTQTLVFERNGVRTIIRYTGPRIEAPDLMAFANMMD